MHIHTVVSFLTLNDNIKHVQSKEIIQKAGWFSVYVCMCVCVCVCVERETCCGSLCVCVLERLGKQEMSIRCEALNRLLDVRFWIRVCVCVSVCLSLSLSLSFPLLFSLPSSSFHLGLSTYQPQDNQIPCMLTC